MTRKVTCLFSDIPKNTNFYIKRYPDGCSADSLGFTKTSENSANSLEFGEQELHANQPCWYFN